jgi:HSP20 family protein
MPRREKSFFGKIMGGDVTDVEQEKPVEVEEEDLAIEEDIEPEELVDVEDEAEGVYEEYEDEEEVNVPVQAEEDDEPRPVATNQKEEDWMSDYEGALNIDMYQTKDNVIIKSTIAGVRPDDIDITVANDMVTIKGTRQREETINQDDYFYQECYWGSFSRSVIVPVDIDSEEIEADLKDGILTVVIPKAAKAKTKKVKVKGL